MSPVSSDPASQVIVALDVDSRDLALALVDKLQDLGCWFKVGSQLFTSEGPGLVKELTGRGARVFLDLKFHDIPNTVAGAVRGAARLGVAILNVHALGGKEMMRAALAASGPAGATRTTQARGARSGADEVEARPAVIAVTVLTSMDQATVTEVGIAGTPDALACQLAELAASAGLDGVVASPREIRQIRERVDSSNFIIVTPGVRPAGSLKDDQKRVATPAQALSDGADYIVIGRPITAAEDPRAAFLRMLDEL